MRTATMLCLAMLLNACGAETTTYSAALDDGSGGVDAVDGSTIQAVSPVAGGAIGAGGSTSAPVQAEPLCVPGQSAACACSDGASSAQVCAADGQSYGTCDCGPAEVVEPAGYSGECVSIGPSSVGCPKQGTNTFINCPSNPTGAPAPGTGFIMSCTQTAIAVPGMYCCAS